MSDDKRFLDIKEYCIRNLTKLELWKSYYERRYLEFLSYYGALPQKKYNNVLELGCGIGYNTAFLAKISENIIATDLEQVDPETHSPGLEVTRDFLNSLGVTNVKVMHASAEELPFPDNSFDMVFSVHVLEHVPDKLKAIDEINRVLKPGGINFCVVPTRMDRINAFFINLIYLLNRIIFHLLIKPIKTLLSKKVNSNSELNNDTKTILSKSSAIKSFPFPVPHGAYNHYLDELKMWSFFNWEVLITKNQSIKLLSSQTSQINPVLPFLSIYAPLIAVGCHKVTRRLEYSIGKTSIFKRLGFSGIFITQKQ